MTSDEKMQILLSLEKKSFLTQEDFKLMLDFSSDNDSFVKCSLASLFVNFTNEKSKRILLEFLSDKNINVRIEAADSLSYFNDNEVVSALKNASIFDKNYLVRGYAISSIGHISKNIKFIREEIFEHICNRLSIEKMVFCKLNCYFALYLLGKKQYLDNILKLINTKSYRNRCAVVNTLAELCDKNNIATITTILKKRAKIEKTVAVSSTIYDCLVKLQKE